jgi:hypothetical protein
MEHIAFLNKRIDDALAQEDSQWVLNRGSLGLIPGGSNGR